MMNFPRASMTSAPAGVVASAPTAVIRPSDTTTVTSERGGAPVPSISVAWVNARTERGDAATVSLRQASSRYVDGPRRASRRRIRKMIGIENRGGWLDVGVDRDARAR
jgi:hypothetical protein